MDAETFEGIVASVLDALPEHIASRAMDIAVVVEDEPSEYDRRVYGTDGMLLGRYTGVPLTRRRVRGQSSIARMPDLIKLYQGPIERAADGDEARVTRLVGATLHREIGRYFGLPAAPYTGPA